MLNYRTTFIAAMLLVATTSCKHSDSAQRRPVAQAPAPVQADEAVVVETDEQAKPIVRYVARAFVRALLANDLDEACRNAYVTPEHRPVIAAMALNLSSERLLGDAMAAHFVDAGPGAYAQAVIEPLKSAEVHLTDGGIAELRTHADGESLPLRKVAGRWLVDIDALARQFPLPPNLLGLAHDKARLTDELVAEIQAGRYVSPQAVQLARLQKMTPIEDPAVAQVDDLP